MFEAFKIGVKISLLNHASYGLAMLSKDFLKTEADATKLEQRLKSIKNLGLAGGLMAGVGTLGLSLFKGPLDEAKKFETEVQKFKALGLGDAVNTDAVKFAKGMDIMGQSARDNLVMLRDATTMMGDFEHAKEVLPMLGKMRFGIEAVMGGGQGGNFERMFQDALKVSELRGALIDKATGHVDPANFMRVIDKMTQAFVASSGKVTPSDYLAAIKTGGVSTKLMDEEMFFFGLGHFMQESGGSRTGTSSMSMFQNWAMGRMSQRTAEDMSKYGLLNPAALHYGTTGHIKRVDAMGIKDADLFIQNPFKWVNQVAVPQLMAQGLSGDKLNIALAQILGIRTASNLADQFVREQKIADIYVQNAMRASGIDSLYALGKNSLHGQELDAQAKWRNVLLELGNTILPLATRAVQALIPVLKDFAHWVETNQGKAKLLVWSLIGLSGALAIGGTIAIATAALQGLGIAASALGAVGLVGLASTVGSVAAGLGALYIAAKSVLSLLDWLMPNDKQAPGTAASVRWGKGSKGSIAPPVEDAHPGERFVRSGRGGYWVKDDTAAGGAGSPYIGKSKQQVVQVNTELKVDGRVMANSLSSYLVREVVRPTGGSAFDVNQAMPPPGYNYAK